MKYRPMIVCMVLTGLFLGSCGSKSMAMEYGDSQEERLGELKDAGKGDGIDGDARGYQPIGDDTQDTPIKINLEEATIKYEGL